MVRYIIAAVFAATMLSCREIIPFQDTTGVQGYQLNGTLASANGIPIQDADVLITYNYDFISDSPVDTQQVYVTRPTSLVDIAVYTPTYDFVRQIFFDYRTTGPVPHYYWNGRDRYGNLAPSGKYLIRYAVDTTIVKYVPWILEAHRIAVTDARGRFTLSGSQLPVDDVFDIWNNTNTYIGTYSVAPSINLRFTKLTQTSTYFDVGLLQNRITTRTFTLQ